jgi:GTPase
MTRAGFVAVGGRPNVGKSTLVNALIGAKVAIVSDKQQTTRRAVRGVATGPDWQLVLTDLPGVQRPRDKLTERMQRTVDRELGEADAAVLVLSAIQGVGPGDRFIAHTLAASSVPVLIVVNKLDAVRKRAVPEVLAAAEALDVADEIFPVSAKRGHGMEQLREALIARLPEGPFHFPPEDHTDLPLEVRLAELVREPILARTRQEVPHAIEVVIDEIDESRPDLVRVRALAWAETESQKGILIGAGGRMVREIGTAARKEMERELGRKVHLELSVRVRRAWRGDESLLDRLGID